MGWLKTIIILVIIGAIVWYIQADVGSQQETQSVIGNVIDKARGMVSTEGRTVKQPSQGELGKLQVTKDCEEDLECQDYFDESLARCNQSTGVCYLQ